MELANTTNKDVDMDLFNEVFDVITTRWADRRNDLASGTLRVHSSSRSADYVSGPGDLMSS